MPQTKIVSSSANQHPYPGSLDSTTETGGRKREGKGGEELVIATGHSRRGSGGRGGGRGRGGGTRGRRSGRESWEIEEEDEEEGYEGDIGECYIVKLT